MGFDLSSITTGPAITPPRLLVYGPHGVGKTTFLSEAPSPILLPTEDGKGKLDIARDWGWAPDYVEAMWLLLQKESPLDVEIATGRTVSLEYFVES